MKLLNFKSIYAVLVFAALILTSCSESTSPTPSGNAPGAPKNLQATSKDASTIIIKWDSSASETNSNFTGYWVTVTPGLFQPQMVLKAQRQGFTITNLVEGTAYTVTVAAVAGSDTSTAATVIWSPASRFQGSQGVQVYGYSSSKGSGLNLFDAGSNGPKVLTVSNKAQWDLGVDDRDASHVMFGSASQITFGTGTPAAETQVSTDYYPVNSLDETFDSQAMDTYSGYSSRLQDLSVFTGTTNVVFFVRTRDNSTSPWHYAKVLVKHNPAGGFLFGSGNDKYLDLEISYQTGDNVPYARPRS